jgi:hypothetical protein
MTDTVAARTIVVSDTQAANYRAAWRIYTTGRNRWASESKRMNAAMLAAGADRAVTPDGTVVAVRVEQDIAEVTIPAHTRIDVRPARDPASAGRTARALYAARAKGVRDGV